MRVRKLRIVLWSLAAAQAVAGVGFLLAAVLVPYGATVADVQPEPVRTARAGQGGSSGPSLEQFASVWNRDLRRALVDAAGAADASPTNQGPPVQFRLVGTVVELGHSYAVLIGSAGRMELKALGESLDGAEVTEIRDGSITVRHNGREVVLQVPKPG